MPIDPPLLLQGDCLVLMESIQTASVDLVICDLPYGTTNCRWDTPVALPELWRNYRRVLKPNGAVLLFAQTPFDKVLGCSNLDWLRYDLIWEKSNATGHLNAKRMPLRAHEQILVFYDKLPTYNPQMVQGMGRKVATKTHDKTTLYGEQKFVALPYDSTKRYPRSVIRASSDKQTCNLHPTQKPVALLEYLIKTYSNPADVVLDNCMGSGSTGVAARNLNRNFIGIELDADYYQIACNRILNCYD
jgi:DNA modification methylase